MSLRNHVIAYRGEIKKGPWSANWRTTFLGSVATCRLTLPLVDSDHIISFSVLPASDQYNLMRLCLFMNKESNTCGLPRESWRNLDARTTRTRVFEVFRPRVTQMTCLGKCVRFAGEFWLMEYRGAIFSDIIFVEQLSN